MNHVRDKHTVTVRKIRRPTQIPGGVQCTLLTRAEAAGFVLVLYLY